MAPPRILIVHDEIRAASELKERLSSFGYDVAGVARPAPQLEGMNDD